MIELWIVLIMSVNDNTILIKPVGEVNWNTSRPQRAGIILYDQKGLYLGVDSQTKDLTDFGGEINYVNEDTITGAIREYTEETLGVFPKLTWFDVFNSKVILANNIVVFLVKIDTDLTPFIQSFKNNKNGFDEISDIQYVSVDNVQDCVIYSRVRSLLLHMVNSWESL